MRIIENKNKNTVEKVRKSLKQNNNYCPCKIIKNKDTKCICKEFRESTALGFCHCGLYEKVEL